MRTLKDSLAHLGRMRGAVPWHDQA